jgi:hypothetical protein
LFEPPAGLRLALGVPKETENDDLKQRRDIMLDFRFRRPMRLAMARIAMTAISAVTPAVIGAYVAGKGSLGVAAVIFIVALLTGVATATSTAIRIATQPAETGRESNILIATANSICANAGGHS